MVLAGIICIICGFALFIFSLLSDKLTENGKIFWHWMSGFIMCFGLFCILPPFKFPKNTDITVQTKKIPEINKEIFVNAQGNADTTYHYMFTNASAVETVE